MIAVFLLFSLNEIMTYPEPFEELYGSENVSVPGLGFKNHAETVIIM